MVRGIARGAGSSDIVASPTFTISKQYKTPRFSINHFDFYRLDDAGLIAHELAEMAADPEDVVIVEWGGIVQEVLPKARLKIHILRAGENVRKIDIQYLKESEYLLKGIK